MIARGRAVCRKCKTTMLLTYDTELELENVLCPACREMMPRFSKWIPDGKPEGYFDAFRREQPVEPGWYLFVGAIGNGYTDGPIVVHADQVQRKPKPLGVQLIFIVNGTRIPASAFNGYWKLFYYEPFDREEGTRDPNKPLPF